MAGECGCQPEDIINFDLMLADTQLSCVGGLQNEFIYSGRLDNQMSAYCAVQVRRFTRFVRLKKIDIFLFVVHFDRV